MTESQGDGYNLLSLRRRQLFFLPALVQLRQSRRLRGPLPCLQAAAPRQADRMAHKVCVSADHNVNYLFITILHIFYLLLVTIDTNVLVVIIK